MTVEEMRNADGAANAYGQLILVVGRLCSYDALEALNARSVCNRGPGRGGSPGIELGVADKICDCAMVFVGAGFERVVFQSSALIFGGGAAGKNLNLVDGLHGNNIEDGTIVALLADGR